MRHESARHTSPGARVLDRAARGHERGPHGCRRRTARGRRLAAAPVLPAELVEVLDDYTRHLAAGARAAPQHTVRAYRGDVASLLEHARRMGRRRLPTSSTSRRCAAGWPRLGTGGTARGDDGPARGGRSLVHGLGDAGTGLLEPPTPALLLATPRRPAAPLPERARPRRGDRRCSTSPGRGGDDGRPGRAARPARCSSCSTPPGSGSASWSASTSTTSTGPGASCGSSARAPRSAPCPVGMPGAAGPGPLAAAEARPRLRDARSAVRRCSSGAAGRPDRPAHRPGCGARAACAQCRRSRPRPARAAAHARPPTCSRAARTSEASRRSLGTLRSRRHRSTRMSLSSG